MSNTSVDVGHQQKPLNSFNLQTITIILQKLENNHDMIQNLNPTSKKTYKKEKKPT